MKKIRAHAAVLTLSLALSLVATSCSGGTSGGSSGGSSGSSGGTTPVKLTVNNYLTSTHCHSFAGFEPWLEEFTEVAGDNADITYFPEGELIAMGKEYDAMKEGAIDICLFSTCADTRFVKSDVIQLPALSCGVDVAAKAIQNLHYSDRVIADGKTYYDLEFTDKGLVAVPLAPGDDYALATIGPQFNSVSDFSSALRIRSVSLISDLFCKSLGLTAVNMNLSDAYDSMSRGALDGCLLPYSWATFSLDPYIKYIVTGLAQSRVNEHIVTTIETYNSFTDEMKQCFDEGYKKYFDAGCEASIQATEDNMETMRSYGDVTFVDLSELAPEVQDKLNNAVLDTWYGWIDHAVGLGEPGLELAILWRDCMLDAGAKLPEELNSLESYVPNV